MYSGWMLTQFKKPHENSWRSHVAAGGERRHRDDCRPSGRHGGPGAHVVRRNDSILLNVGMESYSTLMPFEEALNRLRRALSRFGFEILRECDVGARIRSRSGSDSALQCRILYVTDPELFATAISTHASVALWLPVPLVVCKREDSVAILLPAELIVRDRAALLGLRALVEQSYDALAAALKTVAAFDAGRVPGCG
jgi:uncharacterized protein (DUF302 family)